MLYTMGLRDALELDEMVEEFLAEKPVEVPDDIRSYDYEEFLGIDFRLVNSSDYYVYDEDYGIWRDKTEDEEYMKGLVENGETLTIVRRGAAGSRRSRRHAGRGHQLSRFPDPPCDGCRGGIAGRTGTAGKSGTTCSPGLPSAKAAGIPWIWNPVLHRRRGAAECVPV